MSRGQHRHRLFRLKRDFHGHYKISQRGNISHRKKKIGKFEKISFDKSEITDERSMVNIGGIADTAEKTTAAADTAKTVAVGTVKFANKARKKIQTGFVHSNRRRKEFNRSVRDIGLLATTANTAVNLPKNVVKGGAAVVKTTAKATLKTGLHLGKGAARNVTDKVMSAKIDKSIVYDSGIEAAKHGITYVRRMENTVKAIKNANKARKAGTEVVKAGIKLLKKKSTWIVLLAAVGIFFITTIASMIGSLISGTINTAFGWAYDDTDSYIKLVHKYSGYIDDIIKDIQKDIDDTYYGFQCDRKEYGDHSEIHEFRDSRFSYNKINMTEDKKADIIAIAATNWYKDYIEDGKNIPDDFKLKKSQLKDIVEKYYCFEYHYEYDYCPHYWECEHGVIMVGGDVNGTLYYDECYYCYWHGCKEITKWVNPKPGRTDYQSSDAWDRDVHVLGTRHFCDNPNHRYLAGKVENYSTAKVLYDMGFTDTQKVAYKVYDEQITEWLKQTE